MTRPDRSILLLLRPLRSKKKKKRKKKKLSRCSGLCLQTFGSYFILMILWSLLDHLSIVFSIPHQDHPIELPSFFLAQTLSVWCFSFFLSSPISNHHQRTLENEPEKGILLFPFFVGSISAGSPFLSFIFLLFFPQIRPCCCFSHLHHSCSHLPSSATLS